MSKYKKLLAGISASIVCLTLATTAFAVTSSGDTADRLFDFRFSQGKSETELAYKQNDTPVYMTCISATHKYNGTVYTESTIPQSGIYQISDNYLFDGGTTHFMDVDIYFPQNRYQIKGTSSYWDTAAWGYWSPDSIS